MKTNKPNLINHPLIFSAKNIISIMDYLSPTGILAEVCEIKLCYHVLGAVILSAAINSLKAIINFECCSVQNLQNLVVSSYLQASQIIMVTVLVTIALWYFGMQVNDEKMIVMILTISALASILLVNGVLATVQSNGVTRQHLTGLLSL